MAIKKGLFIIPDWISYIIVVIHFRKGKSWGILQNPFPLLKQKQIRKWNMGLAMIYGNDFSREWVGCLWSKMCWDHLIYASTFSAADNTVVETFKQQTVNVDVRALANLH